MGTLAFQCNYVLKDHQFCFNDSWGLYEYRQHRHIQHRLSHYGLDVWSEWWEDPGTKARRALVSQVLVRSCGWMISIHQWLQMCSGKTEHVSEWDRCDGPASDLGSTKPLPRFQIYLETVLHRARTYPAGRTPESGYSDLIGTSQKKKNELINGDDHVAATVLEIVLVLT